MSAALAGGRSERHQRWMRRALEIAAGSPVPPRPPGTGSPLPALSPGTGSPVPALSPGAEAGGAGDVPVGALVYAPDGTEIGAGRNEREFAADPTAHAEVVAMRQAAGRLGGWRLDGCTLVVTLEPCTMCAGALVSARVAVLVFGAWEPKTGAVGSLWDVVRDRRLSHRPEVYAGVCEAECAALLREFFASRRP